MEIKTRTNGTCEVFKINGQDYGEAIARAEIVLEGNKYPKMILTGEIEELYFNSEKIEIIGKNEEK